MEPRRYIYSKPRNPEWVLAKFGEAGLEIKAIKGLIEYYRNREAETNFYYDKHKQEHPLGSGYSKKVRMMKANRNIIKMTADFLEAYLAILEQRNDL